ncbi:Cell division cycle protein 48-like [Porphyridium purpureum]|uniref:Cell division cycle protein 48-like n=1 Tax=Porphyridium purpureum TaxID=35688 RepID=A0A5J4YV34_PORPP|nr:Cell division cycle protein 48-like [Porphyridium purpureum]|eukprot:POR3268..scf229_5
MTGESTLRKLCSSAVPIATRASSGFEHAWIVQARQRATYGAGDWLLLRCDNVRFWTLIRGTASSAHEACTALRVDSPVSSTQDIEDDHDGEAAILFLTDGARDICASAPSGTGFNVLEHHRTILSGKRLQPVAATQVELRKVERYGPGSVADEQVGCQKLTALLLACRTLLQNAPVSEQCTVFCAGYKILLDKVSLPAHTAEGGTRALLVASTRICASSRPQHESLVGSSQSEPGESSQIRFSSIAVRDCARGHLLPDDVMENLERMCLRKWKNQENHKVLICGPVGSGKSTLLQYLKAKYFGASVMLSPDDVLGHARGGGALRVLKELKNAKRSAAANIRTCVLMDDMDLMCSNQDVMDALKCCMDAARCDSSLYVLSSATYLSQTVSDSLLNDPHDPAVVYSLAAPSRASRFQVLATRLSDMHVKVSTPELEVLADQSAGFRVVDFEALALRTVINARLWAGRALSPGPLHAGDVTSALKWVKPLAISACHWWRDAASSSERLDHDSEPLRGLGAQEAMLKTYMLAGLNMIERDAHMALAAPRGILVCGESGSGKTRLIHQVGSEVARRGANFMRVESSEIVSSLVGESERALSQVFAFARQTAPTILFVENIEILAPLRRGPDEDSGPSSSKRLLSTLLLELDGAQLYQHDPDSSGKSLRDDAVLLIASTSGRDAIDPALLRPGRVEVFIHMAKPDVAARELILQDHLGLWLDTGPVSSPHSSRICRELAILTADRTAPEIIAACHEARTLAIREGLAEPSIENIVQAFRVSLMGARVFPSSA